MTFSPARSPNLQAFIGWIIPSLKHGDLEWILGVSARHHNHYPSIAVDWLNRRRGYTRPDHLPAIRDDDQPPTVHLGKQNFVCRTELGGHLKSYRPAA